MAEEDQTDQVDDETGTDETAEGEEALADAGKKALDAMKVQRAAARKERDAAKARAETAEAELAKLKAAKTDGDKPPEVDEKAIRDAAKAEAQAEVLHERVLDRIETKAAKMFADPEDARALLAARADEFIDDGKIDSDAIAEALADLLKKKPHLSAQGGKRFEGTADQGTRNGSTVKQLTEQDLNRMTPAQIVDAQAKGQLDNLMGLSKT